ncbi:hypothetical protein [Achromobacter xylosoxidans]|uniref:hypothetical protein n=1 Tax=Alcaligenes xylosoxydans xylosoxydans TaxID=85698 RepID=UPI001EECA52D|nr:hypothetical protein [Achromobacter xylosoxidans]
MTGPVHLEHEIVAATVDASGTLVARVDAVADPLGLNPILADLGLAVDYFRLVRILNRHDLAAAVDWRAVAVVGQRRDDAIASDAVDAGVALGRGDVAGALDRFALAFVRLSPGTAVDWARQQVRSVRFDAAVAVDVLALAVARERRDAAASHDSGRVVLENYALDYAVDYVGDATSF